MRLLLLPGTLCDAAVWAPVVAGLPEVECVVADVGGQDDVRAIATSVLAAHPGDWAVAGFSFGGYVALQLAFSPRVERLALVGTRASAMPALDWPARAAWLAEAERCGVGRYVDLAMPGYVRGSRFADPSLGAAVAAMAERQGIEVLRRQMRANRARPDMLGVLAHISMPTLVLWGGSDAVCSPADHRRMLDRLPAAEGVEVADAGHFVMLEQPAAVVDAFRRWLDLPQT